MKNSRLTLICQDSVESGTPGLEEVMRRWRDILDAINDAVCLLDTSGRVQRCNRAMCRLTRQDFEGIAGRDYLELINEALSPLEFVPLEPEEHAVGRRSLLLRTGDRVFKEISDPLIDDRKRSVGTVRVITDITWHVRFRDQQAERLEHLEGLIQRRTAELEELNQRLREGMVEQRRARDMLRLSEQRLRSVVEGASDCIFSKDRDHVYREINPAMSRLFGVPAHIIVGRRDEDFFGKSQAALVKMEDDAVLAGETIKKNVARKIGDTIFYFHIVKFPLRDRDGSINGIGGIARDITERRKTEKEMKAKKRALRTQQANLLKWARSENLNSGDCQAALREITEDAARTLGVERVSIWFFNADRTAIRCGDWFEYSAKQHGSGEIMALADYPDYSRALEEERVIAVQDVWKDRRTRELTSYFMPQGVTSILDAPIHLDGGIVGVVCHEHVGVQRRWTVEEQNFAGSVADFVSLAVLRGNRRRVEECLEEQLRFTQLLIDTIPNPVYYKDQWGRYLGCNAAFERFHGITRNDLLGKTVRDVMPAEWAVRYDELDRVLLERPGTQVYEGRTLRADGEECHVIFYKSVFNGPGGAPAGIVGVIVDVDERERAEDALSESESRYRLLIENAGDSISMVDYEGRLLLVNEVAAGWMGVSPEDLIGRTLWEVLPESAEEMMRGVRQVIQTGVGMNFTNEIKVNGSTRCYSENIQPIRDRRGAVTSAQVISRDITEQKRLEQEIARLDRLNLVGEMAAGIGHEVRNPLATVRGFLQLLSEKGQCENCRSTNDKYYALMIEELDRANAIISEFLSLGKNRPINLKPRNLNSIIDAILPMIKADAILSDKFVRTEVEGVPDLPLDEKEIRQLILNLARNGIEAMRPGGVLTIATDADAEGVVLAVRDEGRGIDPEIIDRLGTPFLTTKEEGTGLGLAVCYSIAARHNAVISVASDHRGTSVSVRFKRPER